LTSVRRPLSCHGQTRIWSEQNNLLPELLRSFHVAQHCMTSHCYTQALHIGWVMTQRVGGALNPLLIVPKKEVGVSQPVVCENDADIQRT
jgi:hypothetical protein